MPNFGKLNPIKGLGNMFSTNALVELLKAIAKTVVVGAVAYLVVMSQKDAVFGLAVEPLRRRQRPPGRHAGLGLPVHRRRPRPGRRDRRRRTRCGTTPTS